MIAPGWNTALERLPYFATETGGGLLGTIKDQTNALAAQSISLIKGGSVAGSAFAAQNNIIPTISQLVNVTTNAVEEANKKLFDGTDDSIDLLYGMINQL